MVFRSMLARENSNAPNTNRNSSGSTNAQTANRALPQRLRNTIAQLERVLGDVITGHIEPERAEAAAAVAGALVQLVEAGALERRLGELEARIEELTRQPE